MRPLRHGKPILGAVRLQIVSQAIAKLRSKAVELLRFTWVFEMKWACFHRVVSFFVAMVTSAQVIGLEEELYKHGDALAIALTSLIQPFFDPAQEQGIRAFFRHDASFFKKTLGVMKWVGHPCSVQCCKVRITDRK